MASCFCGCGRKLKFTRRALNGTGRLVHSQLEEWDKVRAPMIEVGSWSDELQVFYGEGRTFEWALESVVHYGPPMAARQSDITAWLRTSETMLAEVKEILPVTAAASESGELRSERDTSEEPGVQCPICGRKILTPGTLDEEGNVVVGEDYSEHMTAHYNDGWRRTGDGYTSEDYEKL